jgi:hypothetical protein
LFFHAYVKEMHGSRSKIPSKNLVRQRCAEGFSSDVKVLLISCLEWKMMIKRALQILRNIDVQLHSLNGNLLDSCHLHIGALFDYPN